MKRMYKLISITLIVLHIVLTIPIGEVFASEYRLKASSISSGKETESATYKLKQTVIGEPFGGVVSNDTYTVRFGYLQSTASNYPILLANIPDGFASGSIDLDSYFEDPLGGVLTYASSGGTNINISIDPSTHIVTYSKNGDFVGSEEIFFIATNQEGSNTSSNGVILTIKEADGVNNNPMLHSIKRIIACEGDTVSLNASAYDADGDTLTYIYSCPFDAEGKWLTGFDDAGRYAITIDVSDGRGGTHSIEASILITETGRPPVVENMNISRVYEGTILKLEPVAFDPDADFVEFIYQSPFDQEGSWHVPYNCTGSQLSRIITTTIIATDGINSTPIEIEIEVINVNKEPTVDISLTPTQVSPGDNFTIAINALDLDDDNMLLTLKKIKGDTEEVIEDNVGPVEDRGIISIYNTTYSVSENDTYIIKAVVEDVTTLNPKETVASAILNVTSNSGNYKPISGDFDGNGMTDIGFVDTSVGAWHISLSEDGNFTSSTPWIASGFCTDSSTVPLIGDFDGNSKTDIGYFDSSGTFRIKLSTGSSFSNETIVVNSGAATQVTKNMGIGVHVHSAFTGDVDGNGLTDIGFYHNYTNNYNNSWEFISKTGGEKYIAYSNGDSFTSFTNLLGENRVDSIPIVTDFNSDGFSDFCFKDGGTWKIIICKGDVLTSNQFTVSNFASGSDPIVGDFTQDGLTDIGYFDENEKKIYYKAFTGEGFGETKTYLENITTIGSGKPQIFVSDYNGDSILDAACFDKSGLGINKWAITLHNSALPDLLVDIDNGVGGNTAIAYERSTVLDNTGGDGDPNSEDLPFPVRVVKSVTKTTSSDSYITTYEYCDGFFETDSREFRGFGYVKVLDPEQNFKETFFNQDDIYKGRPENEIVYDKHDRKIQEINYDWQSTQYHDQKTTFPYLDTKTTTLYDYKTGNSKEVATSYEYDEYGNAVNIEEEGFTDDSGDERETNVDYEYNTTKWILSKPSESSVIASAEGAKQSRTKYTYDDNGSLTKEEKWLDTESKWISTDFTYDSYGNVLTVTDALGRTTATTYGSTNTFPQSVTNALGHTQSFTYSYETGKILTSTDPNNQTTESKYDSYGRLEWVEGPGGISKVNYYYDLESRPVKVTTETVIARSGEAATKQSQVSYADSLGRTIETITEADNGKYILSGIVEYDSRGQVIKKYLPNYIASDDYQVPTYDGKHVTYVYDPLGRVIQTIRPDGKVSQNIYSITTTESINENGQRKRIEKDAYGHIIKVEEFNDDETYETTYEYDTLGNLTKTIDCERNETEITYDSLGRKTSMTDLDMGGFVGESWFYEYDDVGNLISQTDAKGDELLFEYDNINRLKKKSSLRAAGGGEAILVEYTYDQNTNGIGRLSAVADSSGTTEFTYDILGRETKTVKKLGTVPEGDCPSFFTVERTYDSLDRLTSVTYPDVTTVTYLYNKQGGIKKVGIPGDDDFYVKETRYNIYGQIEYIKYGNNSETTYNYDEDTLRLTDLDTLSPVDGAIQDLSYTFDPLGNITQMQDVVNTSTQYFNYDDLNRLIQATNERYDTIEYEYSPIGNMIKKGDTTMQYGQGAGPHAVTSYGDTTITYDDNGNMQSKGDTTYAYDTENKLTQVNIPKGGEVSTTTIDLDTGWNFISIPYKNIDVNGTLTLLETIPINNLLTDINGKYDQVAKYDSENREWKNFVKNSKFDEFSKFEFGKGYIVYATEACTFNLTGATPSTVQEITLYPEWNLICSDEDGESRWEYAEATETLEIPIKAQITEYLYDGDGGRVARTIDDRTTIYIGSSYEILIDNTTGDVIKSKKNIFMGSSRVCEVEENFGIGEIHAYFVHADHIGSSNILTNETGSRVSLFEYKPFGSLAYAAEDNSYDTDKRFNGRTTDASTGLIFYGGRYYQPDTGRWLTADPTVQHPYDPQNLNRYSFLQNNPINGREINGYGFWSWLKKAWKVIAAVAIVAVTVAISVAAPQIGIPMLQAEYTLGIIGGVSAAMRGGDVGSGILFGVTAGAVGGLGMGAMGPALGAATESAAVFGAMAEGAIAGTVAGATGAYAGGKGSIQDTIFWAAIGNVSGAVLNGIGAALKASNPSTQNVADVADRVKDAKEVTTGIKSGTTKTTEAIATTGQIVETEIVNKTSTSLITNENSAREIKKNGNFVNKNHNSDKPGFWKTYYRLLKEQLSDPEPPSDNSVREHSRFIIDLLGRLGRWMK